MFFGMKNAKTLVSNLILDCKIHFVEVILSASIDLSQLSWIKIQNNFSFFPSVVFLLLSLIFF